MLSSKMSADEEEAVMKELAKLQAEIVSRDTRWFLVSTTMFFFQAPASSVYLPDAPVSEPVIRPEGESPQVG